MLRTYIALAQRADVEYTMSILDNEQPNNYFTQLSKLDYADYIYNLNEKEKAVNIYENTYFNTKKFRFSCKSSYEFGKEFAFK